MLELKTLAVAAAIAGAVIMSGQAVAQGGAGQGAGGGMGSQSGAQDRDQLRVKDPASGRDQLQDRDRDQIRDLDQDRLFLGTKDRIRAFDRDGDRQINRVEFEDWHKDMFGNMDADGNGLSLEEYHAARFGAGPYSNANLQRQALMREQANLRKTERFRIMDGNGDRIVSREEYMRFGEHAWLEADTNDDGQLTWAELQQHNRGM
ncbi:hypothetical protein [Hyphomonas sp.]|uniref:hypothetical protein n=1 Tax=Hyphomonas sp. TaxID=87 RepID=UPI0025B954CD|nr:hypothetical protein [Hyphomonas sp.]